MANWRKMGVMLAVLSMLVLPLSASATDWDLPSADDRIAVPPLPPELQDEVVVIRTFTGVVEWVDLEGGFYAIEGHRLIADGELLESNAGHLVRVTGSLALEPSIYMVPAIKVEEMQRVQPGEVVSLVGELVYEDLEGGFFAVKGYRLTGELDEAELEKYLGRQVQVTGTISDEISIFMTKAFEVASLRPLGEAVDLPAVEVDLLARLRQVEAMRSLPRKLLVDGAEVQAVGGPVQRGEAVLVPLRHIVEAAGGKVHWNGERSLAKVVLPGRTAQFVVGEGEAELNEEGVYYVRRNLISLAQPTQLIDSTTYVSADALSSILGFMARETEPDVLDLVSPAALKDMSQPEEPEWEKQILVGHIVEVEAGERTRVLLQGGPMASGEPLLVWLYINEDTEIAFANGETAQFDDLAVDQQISVQVSGPMLTSYPAQAGADAITILPESGFGTVAGTITDIATEGKPRILVDGTVVETQHPMLIWLTLDEQTVIEWAESDQQATFADLAVGQTVEAALSGPVMESYPCQGGATKVTIVK
ncbi:MAG: copper amine oxidase N-terminal domain-containing protein [Firmicutes bacterium]|nr:copper amine oxidase N-terminal domain-containing protein [Bacillota bacterium]